MIDLANAAAVVHDPLVVTLLLFCLGGLLSICCSAGRRWPERCCAWSFSSF
jgi:hypothetical protein